MDKQTETLLQGLAALIQNSSAPIGRTKTISGTPDVQLIYGNDGIFSNFGLDDSVVNASLQPRGMASIIPAYPTVYTNPVYPYITGFDDDGGSEPTGPCDDAPGGTIEVCHQTAAFGRVARASKEMEANELMQVLNGNINTNLRVHGEILPYAHQLLPQITQASNGADFINSVIQTQMVIVGVLLQNWLVNKTFSGDPANNTSGGYAEFPGLEFLVSTGKVDAFSGNACTALDSDVKDFTYESVDSSDKSLVNYLSMMHYYLESNASYNGLSPVDWVIAMRRQLFYEVTAVWPTEYLTHRGTTTADEKLLVITNDNHVRMRDEMRAGQFLWINGQRIPVVLDDGITEYNNINNANLEAGEFASDIYILPLSARGMPTLYWEFLDYAKISPRDLSVLSGKQRFWVTDGGRYMWALQDTNYCFKIQAKLEPRLVLRAPHLAGRLQNVKYQPLQHLRDGDYDSPYHPTGGETSYSTPPTYHNEWDQN